MLASPQETKQRVIVLKGVYSARPELGALVDLRVVLEVPDRERLRRLHAREGGIDAWRAAWLEAEVEYFGRPETRASFDVVLRGDTLAG